ncbi:ASCH domain-containing protein [Falsiroseomonas stagni]|uniref:ASCH domain-containing protein n=1 Tax=Falsiroseomonas stagni DSM 19981 TaxID=1123062 RepID=A0A1I3XF10_9PROT|nr:ASCH domain-containing protein [Falsiroseomonas stagni]MBX9593290.1 ASCH domain-containing protein [Roseomonas sp.]SFK18115.1 ASCH domain-containing protein [Falsiroseomonas stagni DSM 19981]
MRGLIIREPWIDYILTGAKTWEMRTRPTNVRGRIALIRKGAGVIVGYADLVGTEPPVDASRLAETRDRHRIPASEDSAVLAQGWVYPWVLANVKPLPNPLPYAHPSGAVVWVELDRALEAKLASAPAGVPERTPPRAAIAVLPAIESAGASISIAITAGNLNHGHIYLHSARHLLPEDVIGGSNSASAAPSLLTVEFVPGDVIETDVPRDKMILRKRGPVRKFFEDADARAGESVLVQKMGTHRLRITMDRGRRSAP